MLKSLRLKRNIATLSSVGALTRRPGMALVIVALFAFVAPGMLWVTAAAAKSAAVELEAVFAENACWELRVSESPGGEVWVIGKVPSAADKKKAAVLAKKILGSNPQNMAIRIGKKSDCSVAAAPKKEVVAGETPEEALVRLNVDLKKIACSALNAALPSDGVVEISGTVPDMAKAKPLGALAKAYLPSHKVTLKVQEEAKHICVAVHEFEVLLFAEKLTIGALDVTPTMGSDTFTDGDLLRIKVQAPSHASHIAVDYFTLAGSVYHLFPEEEGAGKAIPAKSSFGIGDPDTGGSTWEISAPFGVEWIAVTASAKPLFSKSRPFEETATVYLKALSKALKAGAGSGQLAEFAQMRVITQKE